MRAASKAIVSWLKDPILFVRENFGVEPDEWQKDVLMAFNQNQRLAMLASKGVGKEQPVSTLMPTPRGYKTMGSLKPGDHVFSEDGSPTEILGVYPQGIKDVYEVFFDDGSHARCGLDHLWKVRGITEKRKKTWSVLSLKEIINRGVNVKEYSQFQIPKQGAARYKHRRRLPLKPYLVGVWIGDGSKRNPIFTSIDPEISEEIKNLGYEIEIKQQLKRTPSYYIKDALKDFNKLEIYRKGSHERFIPDDYKFCSVIQRKDLLCGLMDTDGTVINGRNSSTSEYNTTSKRLADDIVELVRSLGGKAWIKKTVKRGRYKKDGAIVECKDCYRVTITTDFCHFKLPRKVKLWKKPTQDRYFCRTIKSVRLVGRENSVCISVKHPSCCYLTNDYIVTHNTTILAWLCWYFLATRPNPKIAATSISWDNLADGLWAEMAKWQSKSAFLTENFQWNKTRIACKDASETWFMSARSWAKGSSNEQQANSLAGLHADYIMFVLDESGGIPDAVMAAAEAALSSGIECKLVQAGNPTHLEGPLYRAASSEKHLWHLTEINSDPNNPKRSPRVSIQWAKEQIEKFGIDNPWVLVNVFGRFPPSSINALLGIDEVKQAMARKHQSYAYETSQKRLGIDVARMGDDSTVIFPRQGLMAFRPVEIRGARTNEIAARVSMAKSKWQSEMEFVDGTGGFGAGVVDSLIQAGHSPQEIHFSSKADDPQFFNKRAEMWFRMAEWIKRGGSIPNVDRLVRELCAPTYSFKNGKLILEDKDQIKSRLGFSLDYSDALGLTFAYPEMSTAVGDLGVLHKLLEREKSFHDQNPIEREDNYDPFSPNRI